MSGNANLLVTVLGAGSFALQPAVALPQKPIPVGANLYVGWGHSEAGGHDRMDMAPKVEHGANIWAIERRGRKGRFIETQDPPANTFGSQGPSPNNYFADQLIADGKATDVALIKCPGGGTSEEGWRVGIKGKIRTLNRCMEMVKHAVDVLGLRLSGG